jgi:hypothetical protein
MPGYVPPKDPARRARRNKDTIPTRIFAVRPVDPYPLPDDLLPPGDTDWHPATRRWWARWCESPLAADLPAVDWSELEATAVLHHQYMHKRTFTLAGELRLRMQLFGATPLDRARLRYQVANAEGIEAENDRRAHATSGQAAKQRYGLRAVNGTDGAGG